MKYLVAFSEHYHKQAAPVRLAEQHEALLALGVPRVIGDAAEWITEYRRPFLECDLVLGAIDRRLRTVPLEPRRLCQASQLRALRCA